MVELEGTQQSFSGKMYGFYLHGQRQLCSSGGSVAESFLVWHRSREYDSQQQRLVFHGGRHQQATFSRFEGGGEVPGVPGSAQGAAGGARGAPEGRPGSARERPGASQEKAPVPPDL